MLDGNIFKQAKELIKAKPISEMTIEEVITYKAAMISLNLPEYQGMTIDEGLDELANIWDGKEEFRASHTRRVTQKLGASQDNRETQ